MTARPGRWARILVGTVTVLLVLAAAAAVLFWRYPIATLVAQERWALRRAGFERQTVATPRGEVTYFRAGSGTPLLLVHGANDQAGTWAKVAPALAARHRVIVPDLAGHGESAPADGPLEAADLVAGLEAVLGVEAAGERVAIAGNSLGGFLGLVLAVREPARVSRVVLVNGAALREEHPEAAALLLPKTRDDAAKAFTAILSQTAPRVPAFILDDLVRRSPGSPLARLMAAPPASVDRFALEPRLASLGIPVSLVWGEDDRVLDVAYARRVAAAIPGSALTTIPRCGHVPQRECPDALGPALDAALAAGRGEVGR
jgi:pimeloyl-ACP methyl ester carboxylesterase